MVRIEISATIDSVDTSEEREELASALFSFLETRTELVDLRLLVLDEFDTSKFAERKKTR